MWILIAGGAPSRAVVAVRVACAANVVILRVLERIAGEAISAA